MTDVERQDGNGHVHTTRERIYWYDMPSLEECRKAWDDRFGGTFGWPTDDVEAEDTSPRNDEPY
jgi:hypothetical protein